MVERVWREVIGDGPLVGLALHDGHEVRSEVAPWLAVSEADRLREEDPFTALWARILPTRFVGERSRFELDLNRPPERAIYRSVEDSWGLRVWRSDTPETIFETSLRLYAAFYARMERFLAGRVEREGLVVLYDVHSYNHRRGGPGAEPAPAGHSPSIDIGTYLPHRDLFAPVYDRFLDDLRLFAPTTLGRPLDPGENVRFPIGPFAQWAHERFPGSVCALSIEVKKFFMDEWTGAPVPEEIAGIEALLRRTIDGVLESVETLRRSGSTRGSTSAGSTAPAAPVAPATVAS